MPRFCFFMCLYVFNGIQASFAGLFDTKKKEPIGGGEPRKAGSMVILAESYNRKKINFSLFLKGDENF
jgi:hypothetical protein